MKVVTMITLTDAAQVLVHPSSKLVPSGAEVIFQCKIITTGVQPHWIINNYEALLPDHLAYLRNQGFFVSSRVEGSTTILTLRVIGTTDKNGTEVYCTSSQRSNTALLLIIEGTDSITIIQFYLSY